MSIIMKKRFNLKEAIKNQATIGAKLLCITSWLSKIRILMPSFEEKARRKKYLYEKQKDKKVNSVDIKLEV